jgi:hypothetical protein
MISKCPLLAELRLMRSRIADVADNVCIWDERRAEFGPVAAIRFSTKQTVNESCYPAIAASSANAGNPATELLRPRAAAAIVES